MKLSKLSKVVLATSFLGVTWFAASAQADELFRVTRSNVSIYLNNVLKPAPEQPILTVNGSTYVPVRSLADESLESFVSYDSKTKSVYIDGNDFKTAWSTVHSETENSHFTLRLDSEKKSYAFGEPIHMWAALTAKDSFNTGEGAPKLTYYLVDADGFEYGEVVAGVGQLGVVTEGEQLMKELPLHVPLAYNMNKQQIEDYEDYMKNTPRPAQLPKGTYTIGVGVRYSVLANDDLNSGVQESLNTGIQIEVK
ncbi:hypothetical protein PCCS19_50460 [Paenibacillus sp. CCS19]|uniref:stalk domain-containing protein n=1 Tax=Paenibacillus sp. CCS19 TaxID=3158387 RepID=UPI00256636EA|nr:stalk domain-containing protein [Paenibacillus cellulosilyticus]GMK41987.1 hypothetical protein PCCS19_50460 [Paenibacillus cellulosilyticus]